MLEVGSLIDGKYEILRKIGQGGMSVVYLAMNVRANKQWAIKELRKDGVQDYEVVRQGLVAETDFPAGLLPYVQADFRLPPTKSTLFRSVLPGKAGELVGRAMQNVMAPRPDLTAELCIGCGKCASLCPAKAIDMVKDKPKIHRSKCIRCFCCQELCPQNAVKVKESWIFKIANKI